MNTPKVTTQTKTSTKTKTLIILLAGAAILAFGYGITFKLNVGPLSLKGLLTNKGVTNVEVGPNPGQIYADIADGNDPSTDPTAGEEDSDDDDDDDDTEDDPNTDGDPNTGSDPNGATPPSDKPWLR